MNPILIATFIINVIISRTVFGFLGLFVAIVGSGATYYLVSKNGRDSAQYWGQVGGIAFAHFFGTIANAPWSNPLLTGVAIIMNLFVVAIFTALGKK